MLVSRHPLIISRVWYSASGYITVVSPLINYGLGHITGSLSPWRYMFIVGGIITILWSLVIYFYMPPDPIRAKGFSERERFIAVARLRVNNAGVRNTHFKKQQVFELFLDEKFWLVFSMCFLCMIAAGPVNAFIPIIIAGFGFGTLESLLLIMPAGFVAGSIILASTYASYKLPRSRIWIVVVSEMITLLSALLLWQLPRSALGGLLYAVYTLAGFTGGFGVLMGLSIGNAAGYTKRQVSSSGIYIGYCLGELETSFWLPQYYGHILIVEQVNSPARRCSSHKMRQLMDRDSRWWCTQPLRQLLWPSFTATSVSFRTRGAMRRVLGSHSSMPTKMMLLTRRYVLETWLSILSICLLTWERRTLSSGMSISMRTEEEPRG